MVTVPTGMCLPNVPTGTCGFASIGSDSGQSRNHCDLLDRYLAWVSSLRRFRQKDLIQHAAGPLPLLFPLAPSLVLNAKSRTHENTRRRDPDHGLIPTPNGPSFHTLRRPYLFCTAWVFSMPALFAPTPPVALAAMLLRYHTCGRPSEESC